MAKPKAFNFEVAIAGSKLAYKPTTFNKTKYEKNLLLQLSLRNLLAKNLREIGGRSTFLLILGLNMTAICTWKSLALLL